MSNFHLKLVSPHFEFTNFRYVVQTTYRPKLQIMLISILISILTTKPNPHQEPNSISLISLKTSLNITFQGQNSSDKHPPSSTYILKIKRENTKLRTLTHPLS